MRRRSTASASILAQVHEVQQDELFDDVENNLDSKRSETAVESSGSITIEPSSGVAEAISNKDKGDESFVSDYGKCRNAFYNVLKYLCALLLVAYLFAAFIIDFHRAIALFVCTVLVLVWHIWVYFAKRNEASIDAVEEKIASLLAKTDSDRKHAIWTSLFLISIMSTIMAVEIRQVQSLVSLLGLLVFLGLTWMTSWKPGHVQLRPVLFSVFVQFIFGYIVIRTSWGLAAMQFLGSIFVTVLGYTNAGSSFVFGFLTDASLWGTPFQLVNGDSYTLGPPFFFSVLPTIIFVSALMSVGYYVGLLPWCVKRIGWLLGLILGTSASESLSAAGNIFVGQTEAPLLVRPFVKEMTASELHAVMTGGFATIAGSVFGIYVSFGIDPVAILAASIMSAPAALAVSKLAYPETEESPTATGTKGSYKMSLADDENVNLVHAATNGATLGLQLMMNIAANLIAFLAIVAMLDAFLGYLGGMVNIELSFTIICSYLFWPVAWLMGIDTADCSEIASILGYKIFANEFVAYQQLASKIDEISARSYYIASFALCGFSNIGAIGVQLGGLIPLAPNQSKKLAKLAISAMIAGNTACLMTACIAGIFYQVES